MAKRDIAVIGGSAGAVAAVTQILAGLPADFPAAVFVALHSSPTSGEWLSALLARASRLPVESPNGERGAHENLWRPAVDVLFRSAAVAYGNRVIAVLTSGELDDGISGLQAVNACGGTSVVHDARAEESQGHAQTLRDLHLNRGLSPDDGSAQATA